MMRSLLALVAMTAVTLAAAPSVHAGPAPRPGSGPSGMSFSPPVDFATEAVPSSAAFNAASGDQVAMLLTRSDLNDSVAVGDFNEDGKPDVAQTNVIAGSVSVFSGDGHGGFAPPLVYPVGVHPNFVATGHLDGDDHLDLATADTDSNTVSVLLGRGDGTFQAAVPVPVPSPRNVAVGDFDGDGTTDMAVASRRAGTAAPGPPGGVAVLTGSGDGTFVLTQLITLTHSGTGSPVGANFVAVGDFNGGGFDDLAVAAGNSKSAGDRQQGTRNRTGDDVFIFLNRHEAAGPAPVEPFRTVPSQPAVRVGASPDAIAVARLNGDRHADLAVMANASGDMTTLLGSNNGRFTVKANNLTATQVPRALAVGDLNRDGIRDLVTANFHGSTVSVLRGNGDGTFRPARHFWSGDATTGVAVGHFDGDRRPDIVAARLQDDELALLRNNPPQPGDGVVVTRDIAYGSPTHPRSDPFAAHHMLDVYEPPPGTPSLNGAGQAYPVLLFVHGGAGMGGDKAMTAHVMRSVVREGIVAVTTDYRLAPAPPDEAGKDEQTRDVQHAFRWVRAHIGAFGGDRQRIFVSGHSHGAGLAAKFGTEPDRWRAQRHIRGLVLVSFCAADVTASPTQPPSLLLTGDLAWEAVCRSISEGLARASTATGADATYITSPDRDHMTVLAHMAIPGDAAREAMLTFMREQSRGPSAAATGGQGSQRGDGGKSAVAAGNGVGGSLPATGGAPGVALAGAGLCLFGLALRRRMGAVAPA
jgi:acetyl esterase/lipase